MMQARKEKKISREELAEKIGTSGPIIGRYERNDMMPSVEIATKISEALEVEELPGYLSNKTINRAIISVNKTNHKSFTYAFTFFSILFFPGNNRIFATIGI